MEFIDLKAQYRALQGEIDANIQRILAGAHFIGGEEVAEFEEKLAAYVGRKHCVSCGNGTDALQLVYMQLKEENLMLRIQNEYLKKLKALDQKQAKKK